MPLIVYLDTQDYIALSSPNPTNEVNEVAAFLQKCIRDGSVMTGYSMLHISEFITRPLTTEYLPDRRARGRLLKQYCNKNAFPFITDLKEGAKFPNNGTWMPSATFEAFLPKRIDQTIKRELANTIKSVPGLNREGRRKLGNIRGLRAAIGQRSFPFSRAIANSSTFPIPDSVVNDRLFERYILGEISSLTLSDRLTNWTADPENFADLWYQFAGRENFLKEFFQETVDKMQGAIEKLIEFNDTRKAVKAKNEKQVAEIKARLVSDGLDSESIRKVLRPLRRTPKLFKPDYSSIVDKFGKGRLAHLEPFIDAKVNGGNAPKKSDFADVLHLVYAYECDLFRCDLATAHALKDFEPFAGKLVRRFVDLPLAIQSRLEGN